MKANLLSNLNKSFTIYCRPQPKSPSFRVSQGSPQCLLPTAGRLCCFYLRFSQSALLLQTLCKFHPVLQGEKAYLLSEEEQSPCLQDDSDWKGIMRDEAERQPPSPYEELHGTVFTQHSLNNQDSYTACPALCTSLFSEKRMACIIFQILVPPHICLSTKIFRKLTPSGFWMQCAMPKSIFLPVQNWLIIFVSPFSGTPLK